MISLKIVVITKNAQQFKDQLEEKSSMIVYAGEGDTVPSHQQDVDEEWSSYSVAPFVFFQRSSQEIFQ